MTLNSQYLKTIFREKFTKGLRFPEPMEREFLDDYAEKSIVTVRLALILGMILYSVFGFLDSVIAPLSRNSIWLVRFAVVVPYLAVMLALSFFSFFKKWMQVLLSITSLIAGFGILAIIIITVEEEISLYYYAGLILVMMWTYTFVKLRFLYATAVCWAITAGYEFINIFYKDILGNPDTFKVFINNNFFFISSNIIGMFACFLIEFYTRKEFSQRNTIAEKQEELTHERNELEKRINIMNNDLEMARKIQQRLIPAGSPAGNMHSLYKPMEAVGGDLFDFIPFEEPGRVGIFLSDVSGHGVPAALITSMIKSSILESKKIVGNPSALLNHLNDILAFQLENTFVTAFYGVFDEKERSLLFSNAGHHPPAVVLERSVRRLDGSRGIPLAIFGMEEMEQQDYRYTNSRAILPKGCKIVMYTDGLVEASSRHDSGIRFGKDLEERMIRLRRLPCREFVENLYGELLEFKGNDRFEDDISVICVDVA